MSKASDRVQLALTTTLGNNFEQPVTVTLSGMALYWLTQLAEEGLETRLKRWREKTGGLGVSEVLSAGEFRQHLEEMAIAVENGKKPKKKRK